MSVQHVEVDQVRENQSILEPPPIFRDLSHALGVVISRERFSNALPCENVADLANADHRAAAFADRIQDRPRRLH